MYTKVARTFGELGIEFNTDQQVLSKYAVDESVFSVMPQMVVLPKSTQEVQSIVRTVRDYTKDYPKISLTVRGAGTGLSGGSLNDSIIMDVQHLDNLGKVEGDFITSGPGRYYRDIHAQLEESGMYFPPYPSSWRICTIGGMVANDAAGPNSLKYGHTSNFVHSLEVVLNDGGLYMVEPLSYTQLQEAIEKGDRLSEIYEFLWSNLETNYEFIKNTKPESSKNTSGYELWDVLKASSLEAFKSGDGTFNAIHAFCGSQGTLGIITNITLQLIEKPQHSDLLIVPIYELDTMGQIIIELLKYKPYNIELFDKRSYELARSHQDFFKDFFEIKKDFSVFKKNLKRVHRKLFKSKAPQFTLMVLFDAYTQDQANLIAHKALDTVSGKNRRAQLVKHEGMKDVLWRIRGSSYSLAKLTPENDRPAAFLEDIVVPPEQIPTFLEQVQKKLAEYGLSYAVHGHGGNGHFHFYPLFDFTDEKTPERIFTIAQDFYKMAQEFGGNICGEHNDGIMRTPFMPLQFSEPEIELFRRFEHVCDPEDIFNPGKKVNPKFDIRGSIRITN